MRIRDKGLCNPTFRWGLLIAVMAFTFFLAASVQAFTLNVVDSVTGAPIAGGFRWLLEEDNTVVHVPGVSTINSIGLLIHKSHAPVVANGLSAGPSTIVPVAGALRYIVSVLPDAGYANNAAPVEIGQGTVTVKVNPLPLPTAQISVFAYLDQRPINNLVDEGDPGLGGCTIVVNDQGGPLSQDAFGNPLGTVYAFDTATQQPIFDAEGNPVVTKMGSGVITTLTQNEFNAGGASNPYNLKVGEALVKYIPPGKYGIVVIPPKLDDNAQSLHFTQTTTIEGTPTIDAWVKANEPQIFIEGFGVGFKHASFGFVKTTPGQQTYRGQVLDRTPWNDTAPTCPPGPGLSCATITGRLVYNHFSKPPVTQGFFPGALVPECWVGLNNPFQAIEVPGPVGGPPEVFVNVGLYAAQCNPDSTFSIPNIPPGDYQLVTWDTPLDTLFGVYSVTVNADGTCNQLPDCNLGDILTLRWFGTLKGTVFNDRNQNGFRDCTTVACNDPTQDDVGIPNQNLNIRFRDGSIYQFQPTDPFGEYEFAEVFPFFKWLIVEVDFLRYKATGMTAVVDNGGQVLPHNGWAMPSFGQLTPQPQFTPSSYPFSVPQVVPPQTPINNPNTGNNLSRTETGPVLLEAMHLFLNQTNYIDWGKIDYPPGENGGIVGIAFYAVTRAENDPALAGAETWEPGIPNVQINLYQDFNADGVPDGPAIATALTDSFDLHPPTGCTQVLPVVNGQPVNECADAFHTWNQVRPGVFDGGYAFGPAAGEPPLTPGTYIVEVVPPTGYLIQKEEDKNVDFGNSYTPSPLVLPPPCVGEQHLVPQYLALFPDQMIPVVGWTPGMTRPRCDRKQVTVRQGQNTNCDFHLFTEVPKAARAVGFTNNDLAAEFNVFSPNFGEKLAPAWIPISFKDWQGNEIARVYTDQFGHYNAMLPSTYSVNVPTPTGVSPNMLTLTLNDPRLPDGTQDPYYNPTYTVTPWTFDYWPGKTSYLDTPLVPTTAFASGGGILDTDPPALTPAIAAVNPLTGGPVLCSNALPASITITSLGLTSVLNPNYQAGVPGFSNLYITRDYGFGGGGTVTLDGVSIATTSWTDTSITATIPAGTNSGRLMVTRSDNGFTTEVGVTLNIIDCATTAIRNVTPNPTPGSHPIQDAVDAAGAGDIIMIAPGLYNENVIMNKPVRLQGYGAGSTSINGNPNPLDRLQAWHQRIDALGGADFAAYLLKNPFMENEAPTIIVMGETQFPGGTLQTPDNNLTRTLNPGNPFTTPGQAAIDGLTLTGALGGGGVFALSHSRYLTVSNNIFVNNQGGYAGGFSSGVQDSGFDFVNVGINVVGNKFHRCSGLQGGGAISMNEGSHNYLVAGNKIIGNFSRFNGAGINHRGLSDNGVIARNQVIFNENQFNALLNRAGDGGGIYVGGGALIPGTVPLFQVAEGSGSVTIDGNLVQGNLTGSGNGGGIIVQGLNGLDIVNNPNDPSLWNTLKIFNNVIVNNVAARAGAGIYLSDVVSSQAFIYNNTVSNNDSTATSQLAFAAGAANSTPQPAGIVTSVHTQSMIDLCNTGCPPPAPGAPPCTPVVTACAGETFSSPALVNNIVVNNRSFFNDASMNGGAGGLAANPTVPVWDLGVVAVPTPQSLSPQNCVLTSLTPGDGNNYTGNGNTAGDPLFVTAYLNELTSATVLDEAGNNINVRYTPLPGQTALWIPGNYHLNANAGPAADNGANIAALVGTYPALGRDFDGQTRSTGIPDIGADEYSAAVPTIFTIAAAAGTGGTISPAGAVQVTSGANQTFNIAATTASNIFDVYVDGVGQRGNPSSICNATLTTCTFTSVNANHTIMAVFGYNITSSATVGGTITPLGVTPVTPDASLAFAITRNAGFAVWSILVDGQELCSPNCPGTTSYKFMNVNADHSIAVSFAPLRKIGVFRGNRWYLDADGSGVWQGMPADNFFAFGLAGDIPVAVDTNGDGITQIGVFRNGNWYLDASGNGIWQGTPTDAFYTFGLAGDIPVVVDLNGNGVTEIGTYRNGTWRIDANGNGIWEGPPNDVLYTFGLAGDIPVVVDLNGDGVTEIGVFRNGTWYLDSNGNGNWEGALIDKVYTFGLSGDKPVTGKW